MRKYTVIPNTMFSMYVHMTAGFYKVTALIFCNFSMKNKHQFFQITFLKQGLEGYTVCNRDLKGSRYAKLILRQAYSCQSEWGKKRSSSGWTNQPFS